MAQKELAVNIIIRRITVDEKLADGIVRILVSRLSNGVKEFFDHDKEWGEEEECLIEPCSYVEKMSITESARKEWSWDSLEEGQVFLSGQFKIIGSREHPKYFVVSPGSDDFFRIDKAVRKDIQKMYFKMLKGEK
jgi:hypothetical protein